MNKGCSIGYKSKRYTKTANGWVSLPCVLTTFRFPYNKKWFLHIFAA